MVPEAYFLAFGANICFGLASNIYSIYSKKISVFWMNFFKSFIAAVFSLMTVLLVSDFQPFQMNSHFPLIISGFIGLGIGDYFLLKSFTIMGPGRTFVIFGFQPLFAGLFAYLAFEQEIHSRHFIAVIFLILCLLVFSIENYKKRGHWEFKGFAFAFVGVSLDTAGILLSRYGFDANAELLPMEGNMYRALGAVSFMVIIQWIRPFEPIRSFIKLVPKERALIIFGCLIGTYLSLFFYLSAIRIGHVASVTAISITSPFFASLFESLITKTKPSKYLVLALLLFTLGFWFLLFGPI